MDTDDTQQKNDSDESNVPRKIRLLVEDLKGSEPFNIEKFLNQLKVDNLSVAELLRLAPSVRKQLHEGLRILL